ncbi:MAG: FHA domain-containing protein [Blastocatellia bacterium]
MSAPSASGIWREKRPHVEATPGELLAEAVKEARLLSVDLVDRLLIEHPEPRHLYHRLLDEYELPEEELRLALHLAFLYPTIDLQVAEVDGPLAAQLGDNLLQERLVLPLVGAGPSARLMIAMANPTDRETIREIEQLAQRPSSICLALPADLLERIERHFTPRLVGALPSGEAVESILNHHETSIGKAGHNRLVIADSTVSGSHAIVLSRQREFSIVDLGSRNGTYLNDQRLGRNGQLLHHGDKIRLGRVLLVFRDPRASLQNRTTRLSRDDFEAPASPPPSPLSRVDQERISACQASIVSHVQSEAPPLGEEQSERPRLGRERSQRRTSSWVLWALAVVGILTVAIFLYRQRAESPLIPDALDRSGSNRLSTGSEATRGSELVPLSPAGNWEKFGTSGRLSSVSAVAHRPGSGGVLLAGTTQIPGLFWIPLAASRTAQAPLFDLPTKMAPLLPTLVSPPQALAYGNGFYYELGTPRQGSQAGQALHRVAISSNGLARRETTVEVSELVRSLAPPSSNGLSQPPVASLAWNPIREELLLVLSPLATTGETLLVPLRMVDPLGPFGGKNLTIGSPSFLPLDLHGETVRSMTYVASRKSFLLLTRGATTVHLWEWAGTAPSPPVRRIALDAQPEPSGLLALPLDNQDLIVLTGRRGTYLSLTSQKQTP